jgi:hypothetical protein
MPRLALSEIDDLVGNHLEDFDAQLVSLMDQERQLKLDQDEVAAKIEERLCQEFSIDGSGSDWLHVSWRCAPRRKTQLAFYYRHCCFDIFYLHTLIHKGV